MPSVTLPLALIIFGSGALAGCIGSMLGLGGGVFLVPVLNLALGFPLRTAAAISLCTVIATSSSVSAGQAGSQLLNMRLAMVLEVATVAGSLLGGLTAHLFSEAVLQRLFGAVTILTAVAVLSRIHRRNVILDPYAEPGALGSRFRDYESGGLITYRVKRLPAALLASFVAGNVSSLLGVGGGILKVPVLNTWCGVPVRAAAATSAFMIGVTATGGAIIYFGRGDLPPLLAAPAVLGVQLGTWAGLRLAGRIPAKWLKVLLTAVLVVVAVLMFVRSGR